MNIKLSTIAAIVAAATLALTVLPVTAGTLEPIIRHTGMCDASAAAALDSGRPSRRDVRDRVARRLRGVRA